MPIISQWLHIDIISIFDVSLWIKSHVWVKQVQVVPISMLLVTCSDFSQSQNPSKSPNLNFLNFLVDPVWVPWFLIDFPHRFSRFSRRFFGCPRCPWRPFGHVLGRRIRDDKRRTPAMGNTKGIQGEHIDILRTCL